MLRVHPTAANGAEFMSKVARNYAKTCARAAAAVESAGKQARRSREISLPRPAALTHFEYHNHFNSDDILLTFQSTNRIWKIHKYTWTILYF